MDYGILISKLLQGFQFTLQIFGLTLFISLPLGLLIALGRLSKHRLLRNLITLYISIMRGTPLMLQLMVVYFGPYFIFGISLNRQYRFMAVIIGFGINYAAYFAEIFRGGIESIAVGQWEAAKILGYSRGQAFVWIILPQAMKRIMPSITNEVITLVKDTSLAFVISVPEMFTNAKALASASTSMLPYVAAGIVYYVFNFAVSAGMEAIEKRLNYYRW